MENIVNKFRPGVLFWDVAPEFMTIEPTKGLYNTDKSKDKKDSSTLMWCIALLIDPDSGFYNLPNKYELLAKDHLNNENFDWESVDELFQLYRDTKLTQAKQSLIAWDEMMKRRDKFIKSQDYSLDHYLTDEHGNNILKMGKPVMEKGTADQLDKMAANTAKIYADYSKIKKDIDDEKLMRGKGNKPKSLSDSNEI